MELAVGEAGADVADVALALADEEREPALGRERIARRGGTVAAGERIAEVVERRASGGQRFLERRERLGDIDRDGLVVGRGRRAERVAIAVDEIGVAAHRRRDAREVAAHLARIDDRPQALRPQAVAGAVPAEPALQVRVGDASACCGRRARGPALAAIRRRGRGPRDDRWRRRWPR